MPMYRGTQLVQAVGTTFKPDLKPNDRFGPRGGHVRIRAKALNTVNMQAVETIFVGNDMVENRGILPSDAAGQVDNFTPAVEAVGGPGDVIDITYLVTGTAATTYSWVVEVENA